LAVHAGRDQAENSGCAFSNLCYLNLSTFREFPKRFERSKAIERLERLERTDPRDERSEAIEQLERLELAAACVSDWNDRLPMEVTL
jgi:hypothetical protein